jgi:hypothetical protein
MNGSQIAELISKYGFPIVAAGGLGFMIHYVWKWVTAETKPVLSEASAVLIALIDRVRMLDNDLIRLNQKLNVILQMKQIHVIQEIEQERKDDDKTDKNSSQASAGSS